MLDTSIQTSDLLKSSCSNETGERYGDSIVGLLDFIYVQNTEVSNKWCFHHATTIARVHPVYLMTVKHFIIPRRA